MAAKTACRTHLLQHMCLLNLTWMGGSVVLSKIETDGGHGWVVCWGPTPRPLLEDKKEINSVKLQPNLRVSQSQLPAVWHHPRYSPPRTA